MPFFQCVYNYVLYMVWASEGGEEWTVEDLDKSTSP